MWKTCVTLALLICLQVCAHGPLYPRVVDGANAQKKAWPWMVSLHDPTCHFCGGSLISSRWVLSAAHCFVRLGTVMDPDSILVYLGKMTQREKNKKEKMIKVQQIYPHNLYKEKTTINDIALLHLSSSVSFNKYISPVCLVAQNSDFTADTSSQIIGWGRISDKGNVPYPGTLQEAEVFVLEDILCQNQMMLDVRRLLLQWNIVEHKRVTNDMICAGVPNGGREDTHLGDSGGPMMSQYCSKWVQSGITSFGFQSTLPFRGETIGVYTRVSHYEQWIRGTIQNHPGPSSQDLPQFVNVNNLPCPSVSGTKDKKWKWCCCM